MRTSQTLTLEMSEKRQALSEVTEKLNAAATEGTEPNTDDVGKADTLTREIRSLEVRYRAAVLSEEEEDRKAAAGDPSKQRAEFDDLETRCSVTAFMGAAVRDKKLDGAELEYRQEVLGEQAADGHMPLRLLATSDQRAAAARQPETRAVTPVADAATGLGSQADIMARVFERSIASELLVSMPSVPMGTRTWPYMSGGTTVSQQAPSGEQEAVAGSFAGETLEPLRLTGSYEFRVEDLELLRGLEDALRRALRMLMSDQMDDQIVNGDGVSPNVNGFLSELPAPDDATAQADHAAFVKAFTGGVDGINAYMLSDIRSVIGKATYERMEDVYRGADTPESAFSYLSRRAGSIRVSNRMPAVAAKDQIGIFARTSYPGTNAVAPVWEAAQLIRDPYTLATKGEVRITMIALWNFKIVRETGFYLHDFQIEG